MSDEFCFPPVYNIEPLRRDLFAALETSLTPMEKLVIGFDRLDPFAGMGWTSTTARCVWRDDGRRITIALFPPHGHCVSVSIAPDPAYPGAEPDPENQAVS